MCATVYYIWIAVLYKSLNVFMCVDCLLICSNLR